MLCDPARYAQHFRAYGEAKSVEPQFRAFCANVTAHYLRRPTSWAFAAVEMDNEDDSIYWSQALGLTEAAQYYAEVQCS